MWLTILVALLGGGPAVGPGAQAEVRPDVGEPRVFVFASPGGVDLKAFVFSSNRDTSAEPR